MIPHPRLVMRLLLVVGTEQANGKRHHRHGVVLHKNRKTSQFDPLEEEKLTKSIQNPLVGRLPFTIYTPA